METLLHFSPSNPVVQFYTLPRIANRPSRADQSALGTIPTRAYRYCDVIRQASGFGWYIYPPCEFWLFYTGREVLFRLPGMEEWRPLESITFPGLSDRFDAACPEHLKGCEPPFLSTIAEPGIVQIWTGLLIRTAPGWSINVRAPANIPPRDGYSQFEGIIETDRWFGTLFTNVRLEATGRELHFSPKFPLIQAIPIPQWVYAEDLQNATPTEVTAIGDWSAGDWAAYDASFVAPARDPARQVGRYAVHARKRRRGCPVRSDAAA